MALDPYAAVNARRTSELADESAQIVGKQTALDTQTQAASAAGESALRPLESQLDTALSTPAPKRPAAEAMPKPPEKVVDPKSYEGFASALMAMAMIGGVASRGNWLGVTSALNGALKGYVENRTADADKAWKEYEAKYRAAADREKQANKEFDDILNDRSLSINEQIARYKTVAARYDRQDARLAAQQKSIDGMWKSYESHKQAFGQMESKQTQVTVQIQDRRERDAAKIAARDGGSGSGSLSPKYESDPEYKRKVDFWAKQVARGGTLPGRFAQSVGKAFSSDVYAAATQVDGGDPNNLLANKANIREVTAEAQKIGTQSASVAIANKELQKFIPLAEQAIDNVPRTEWRPLNQLIQAGENTWSPAQKKLVIANRSVLNAYAQLIQRGAPTVHSLTEAESLLSTADSPSVYKSAMTQLRQEGKAAEEGLAEAHDDLMARIRKIGVSEPKPGAGGSHPAPPAGFKVID